MSELTAYDPEIAPNAQAWLELDEQERISLAEKFHRKARISLPNAKAHAALHAVVENQLALGVGCVVRAIPRLVSQGLSRHDAVHAVASVVTEMLYERARSDATDTPEVVTARYEAAVERLSARGWFEKYRAPRC
jgi:hypothetical protein